MADTVAGNPDPNTARGQRLGNISFPTQRHELKLENIMNEIIPLDQWHFRTDDLHQTPIMNDVIDYQHKATLQKVIANRDIYNEEQKWSSTAIAFARTIHPPNDAAYWAAARRALIVYYWLGNGRNRAKM
jgi:hypothetical protein